MRSITLLFALPCCIGLVAVWAWARQLGKEPLASALEIGFVGGLLGTIAYDVSRLPFSVAGQRIFAPISAYGLWIIDAASSSRFTELTGWLYHFSNGITFGVMYALFMRNRHWGWGILWGLALETIAILTPFARVFGLSGNYYAISIAYVGHVFYGLPLGWLVCRWSVTRDQLQATAASHKWMLIVLACAAMTLQPFWPDNIRRDARAIKGEFRVEGQRLNPDWLRIKRGQKIGVYNPEEDVSVRVRQTNIATRIKSGQKETFSFEDTGIYQMFVETNRQTQSSFVMVEPVEELK
jgi:hypothetical protein